MSRRIVQAAAFLAVFVMVALARGSA